MIQLKNSIFKWKEKKYIFDFATTIFFLTIMCLSFYLCVYSGAPNLIAFILVVIGCFTVITLFLAKHVYIGLIMMVIGGIFGLLTDLWGVSTRLFLYRPETITLGFIRIGNSSERIIPVEIVLSYFFASMWLMQILESIFDQEAGELTKLYNEGEKLIKSFKQMIPAIVIIIISLIIIVMDFSYLQSFGYFSIGVFLVSLVPGSKKIIPILFGIIMSAAGLFFELFCSGEIIPEIVIWTYPNPDWSFKSTFIALIAYGGVGASLASVFLIMLKFPTFQKEISIITIRKRSK